MRKMIHDKHIENSFIATKVLRNFGPLPVSPVTKDSQAPSISWKPGHERCCRDGQWPYVFVCWCSGFEGQDVIEDPPGCLNLALQLSSWSIQLIQYGCVSSRYEEKKEKKKQHQSSFGELWWDFRSKSKNDCQKLMKNKGTHTHPQEPKQTHLWMTLPERYYEVIILNHMQKLKPPRMQATTRITSHVGAWRS